ncbi:S-4TM family putative pore-forming effector [Nostoc sp. PCC 9305]|uniref:S-4TM family putative pore-forming effector n=1 Tax=Nostoc sp. PCC 9305 TaxID=296636 RepID=UPI0039C626EC
MNKIPQEQNIQLQLERLAAQRQLYSDAKSIQNASMILSIPLVVVWSIFIALLPRFQVYAALWGIAVTFLDILILSRWQKYLQEKAAKIQQLFDCDILQLDWSKLNSGSRPEPETIIDSSAKYRHKYINYSKLENWYPINVSQLPIYQARIICQRCNIWWDANLKRRYSNLVIVVLIAITIIVFLVGLIGGLTLEKFVLATLTPLVPTFVFGLRQYIDNNEAATRLDRLRENSESIWQQVVNGRIAPQELETESYNLQNQIYDNRRLSPLIFDWIYYRLQRKNEEEMNRGAEALIQELRQSP